MTRAGGDGVIEHMLGRVKRTTRLDVGLVLAFSGVAYLVWALVAGTTRMLAQDYINASSALNAVGVELPGSTRIVTYIFDQGGVGIDIVGLAWLAVSLLLVLLGSHQKFRISWAWISPTCQALTAALGGALMSWGIHRPYASYVAGEGGPAKTDIFQEISGLSLPVLVVAAVLIWVLFLVWLLAERARFDRHSPTLRDGLRSNVVR